MEATFLLETLAESCTMLREGGSIPGATLGKILQHIASCEIEPGGPYTLPGEDVPSLELNQAIADFLALYSVHIPKLDTFLDTYNKTGKDIIAARIKELLDLRLTALPVDVARRARHAVERTLAGNTDTQMSLMPYYIRESLGERGKLFTDTYIAKLGLENIFFWTAFIVYDDFWDVDESADPRLLPIANLFAREYVDFFTHVLPEHESFRVFFHAVMDTLDAANAWETSNCRMSVAGTVLHVPEELPNYGTYDIKFYPAAGHIFGPTALFVELGYSVGSTEVTSLVSYFKEYLIAMQLNDDLHDWKEDLARGHISTTVHALITEWKNKFQDRKEIHLDIDMPQLEQLFWFTVLVPMCNSILTHCEESRRSLISIEAFRDTALLEQFIIRSEKSARKALAEHAESIDLLSTMHA